VYAAAAAKRSWRCHPSPADTQTTQTNNNTTAGATRPAGTTAVENARWLQRAKEALGGGGGGAPAEGRLKFAYEAKVLPDGSLQVRGARNKGEAAD
jgi:hypothetical protein